MFCIIGAKFMYDRQNRFPILRLTGNSYSFQAFQLFLREGILMFSHPVHICLHNICPSVPILSASFPTATYAQSPCAAEMHGLTRFHLLYLSLFLMFILEKGMSPVRGHYKKIFDFLHETVR